VIQVHGSKIATNEERAANWKILVNQWRNEHFCRDWLSHYLAFTKNGQEPNGIKLTSELLLEQLLTQFLPGLDHQWEAFGAPLLDARLHPMGA
jgi:hypothetical protein